MTDVDIDRDTPPEALLHALLLRLAGQIPDSALAGARTALGEGRPGDVARDVAGGLVVSRFRLPEDDLRLLLDVAPDDEVRADLAGDRREIPDDDLWGPDEVMHRFEPARYEDLILDGWYDTPPVLDLTGPPFPLGEAATGPLDRVARDALAEVPGAVALWRSWRSNVQGFEVGSVTPVFVLDVDAPAAELPAITALLTDRLRAAGEPAPQVETCAAGAARTAYHHQALASAALLWAAESTGGIGNARAFDRVDPVTGPAFDDSRERLTDAERDAVLRYLDETPVLAGSTERMVDVVDPRRGAVVPLDYRTDGFWVWTDTVPYYLRTHGIAPEADLLAHIRRRNYMVAAVTPVGRHRALAELYRPFDAAPARSA